MRTIIWHINRSFCDKSDGPRFCFDRDFHNAEKYFLAIVKHVFRKSPMFGVETRLFLMFISRKTSSKSGTLDLIRLIVHCDAGGFLLSYKHGAIEHECLFERNFDSVMIEQYNF